MSRFDDYRRTGHSPVRLRTGRRRPRDPSTQCAATAERIPSSGPPRAIADFREQHRQVASTLTQADPEEAMTRLRAGTVDLIITADAKEGVHGDIEVVHLMDDPLCAVLPAGHLLATRDEIHLAERASASP